MQNEPSGPRPALDDETIAFAQGVFQHARAGHAQELAELLEAGLPPNLRNGKGDTLLMLASYHGHGEVVRLLLGHGADIDAQDSGGLTAEAAARIMGATDTPDQLARDKAAHAESQDT